MHDPDLLALFENPPNAYRGKPFWSWNGRLSRDELIRQIHVLRDMGMGGFFMHSRTGLATEYLGDEWFDLINACADQAEHMGIEAWLYDEDRWPSGTAGGMVTRDPEFRMRYVRMEEHAQPALEWPDGALAVFACVKDGLAVRDVRRLSASDDLGAAARPGETILVFRVVEMAPSSFYNGATYVDTMNPAATARFVDLTHEQYARRCGDRLGRSIKGIFTDEPHRGALMDPFGGEGERSERQAPWTDALPDRFRAAFGYDIVDRLPELFLQPDGEPVSQVKWHYAEMLMRLFLEGFAEPYRKWCADHRMAVTGHVLHEDSLAAQTAMCGSVMRYYEYMDYPGIDLLSEGNRAFWVAKQLQSAARQLGRRRLLSELYGCTGWQMPFKGHKAVGDWQALFGINVRCHHLSWYTMEGEAKRDFPASIFHQSAWWRAYRHVEDYFARVGLLMDQGERVCDLLVLSPVESVWAQVHPGWSRFLGAVDPTIAELDRRYAEMFHWLQGAQIDFDYGDEDMLARMADVNSEGTLRFGAATYKAVVIGGMTTVRSSTLSLLERFSAAGGRVLFVGDPPAYVDALPSTAASAAADGADRVAWAREAIVAAAADAVGRHIRVATAEEGLPAPAVMAQVRRDADGRTFVMLLNTDREHPTPEITVRVAAQGPAVEWDSVSGARYTQPCEQAGSEVVLRLRLHAAQSRLFSFGPSLSGPAVELTPCSAATEAIALSGPFGFRLSEPNVCVLDSCRWRLGEGEWSAETEVLKADQSVRRALGLASRGGEMLQPWFTGRHGHSTLAEVDVAYGFDVQGVPNAPVELAVETAGLVAVKVNGRPLSLPELPEHWLDVCFARLAVPIEVLHEGRNEIGITMAYHEGIGLEAAYLLGAFGVATDDGQVSLTNLPERLWPGDICGQGLPFYSGAIALELPLPPRAIDAQRSGRRVAVRTPGLSAACAFAMPLGASIPDTASLDVATDARPTDARHMLAWDPHEVDVTDLTAGAAAIDLHVYLTRRNTFGPLHQLPREAPSYGPGNWVTEGQAFSRPHVLWPSGLLEAPEIVVPAGAAQR